MMKLKHISVIIVFFGLYTAHLTAREVRIKQNINREWKFILGESPEAHTTDFDDSSWEDVSLPHSFSIPYFMSSTVYQGYGWYRKEIEAPAGWANKHITLEFEGAFIETEVYLNGTFLGKHVGGYTGFFFDITPYITIGKNSIAIRVNNLWNPRVAPRAGDHQFSGGIYRDVYLNITDPLYVDVYGTFLYISEVNKTSAVCHAHTEVRNGYVEDKTFILKTEIKSPRNQIVAVQEMKEKIRAGALKTITQQFPEIAEPMLWSPKTPHLYTAITTLSIGDKIVDRYETSFGIRKFEWTADRGFFLNGDHYYLRGANVHQDQAGWGDAVTNAAMRRDVQIMKDAGFNCIRGSHYPHDPAFVQACDEIGMIFFQENAFWGMGGSSGDRGWGSDGPSSSCYPPNSSDQAGFNVSVLDQLRKMIKIHRNAASIAAWSMSNEPFFTDASTDEAMKNLLNIATDSARCWDPTREVAIGGAQRKDVDRLGKQAIAFYNGDGASRQEFQNPGVPNLVSEYGSTTAHRPGRFFAGWGDILTSPVEGRNPWSPPVWRSGQIIWCGFDHGTVGGVGLATMGLVDYFRLPKRQYHWYAEAYKTNNPNPAAPQWPQEGVPARLKLEATNYTIVSTDGTDDAQLIITVLDAKGNHINNNLPIELSIISGPGQFPTGRSILFLPPGEDEAADITIRDGQAAIAFRSYYAGKTIIRASASGVESADIEIITHGSPVWQEGVTNPVADRPYHHYITPTCAKNISTEMLLAGNRPSWVSSTLKGTNKANVNDENPTTLWKPTKNDKQRWWKLALEASYCIDKIQLEFPDEANYRYIVEVSSDDTNWKTIVDESKTNRKDKLRIFEEEFGCNIALVRVRFVSRESGLAEVKVGGSSKRK
jgi:hypothetical protein